MANSLKVEPFFKTLSHRELFSTFALAAGFVAVFSLSRFLSDREGLIYLEVTSAVACILTMHILYKIEHGRSNTFIARNLQDYIFVFFAFILLYARSFIYHGHFPKTDTTATETGQRLMQLVAAILVLEIAISLLKKLLKVLRWPIL